jgi:hypothetical protein
LSGVFVRFRAPLHLAYRNDPVVFGLPLCGMLATGSRPTETEVWYLWRIGVGNLRDLSRWCPFEVLLPLLKLTF